MSTPTSTSTGLALALAACFAAFSGVWSERSIENVHSERHYRHVGVSKHRTHLRRIAVSANLAKPVSLLDGHRSHYQP